MHQRSGLERMVGALAVEVEGRQLAQGFIRHRHEFVTCLLAPATPSRKQGGEVAVIGRHDPHFGTYTPRLDGRFTLEATAVTDGRTALAAAGYHGRGRISKSRLRGPCKSLIISVEGTSSPTTSKARPSIHTAPFPLS